MVYEDCAEGGASMIAQRTAGCRTIVSTDFVRRVP